MIRSADSGLTASEVSQSSKSIPSSNNLHAGRRLVAFDDRRRFGSESRLVGSGREFASSGGPLVEILEVRDYLPRLDSGPVRGAGRHFSPADSVAVVVR